MLEATFFIALYLVVRNNNSRSLDMMGGLSALLFYMKLDLGLMAISAVVLAVIWKVVRNRRISSFTPIATYASVMVILGLLFFKSIPALWRFLLGSSQIVLGYSAALSVTQFDMIGGMVLLLSTVGIIVALLSARKRGMRELDPLLVLGLPYLFFTYKEGITRADGHMLIFIGSLSLFLMLLQGTAIFDKMKVRRLIVFYWS